MAQYLDAYTRTKNNLENRTQNKSFVLEFSKSGSEGRRPVDQTVVDAYEGGDFIVIGTIPGGSNVTKITALVDEAFDTDTSLSLGFSADYPAVAVTAMTQAPLVVDEAKVSVQGYLSISGNRKADGTNLTAADPRASIWLGTDKSTRDRYIVAEITGIVAGTALTSGACTIVVEYDRFGTNEGAY